MKAMKFTAMAALCLLLTSQSFAEDFATQIFATAPVAQTPAPITYTSPEEALQQQLETNFQNMGGNLIALKQAMCFHKAKKDSRFQAFGDPSKKKSGIGIGDKNKILIFDLTMSSRYPRLFLVHVDTGEIEASTVAHGRGRGEQEKLNEEYARFLGNGDGSFLSSSGWFITGEKYKLNNPAWGYGIHLYGLQPGLNHNVYARQVVMHRDPGMQGELLSSKNVRDLLDIPMSIVQPLSWGCLMLPPAVADSVIERVQMPKDSNLGTLLYAFSEKEKNLGPDYCGQADEKN